jgi:hypothetical protein
MSLGRACMLLEGLGSSEPKNRLTKRQQETKMTAFSWPSPAQPLGSLDCLVKSRTKPGKVGERLRGWVA